MTAETRFTMLIYGIDPGKTGAWAAISHTGKYHTCGDMHHTDTYLLIEDIWSEILLSRDGQDCEVVVEEVHSMPRDGVRQAFSFGMAYGGAVALAQRFKSPWHLVRPQMWKKNLGLSSDKKESLKMARELWPAAPLDRVKDNGRAEALLLAEYWRRQLFDV